MATVSEKFADLYRARREMSDPADLAWLFIARLYYPVDTRMPVSVTNLIQALETGDLEGVEGRKADDFAIWVRDFLTLGRCTRGVSFYPIHPVLSRSLNREEPRADGFILTLVQTFSTDEPRELFDALWGNLPPFEQAIYDLVEWQIEGAEQIPLPVVERVKPGEGSNVTPAAAVIVDQTRQDLLALAREVNGVQSFIDHAGRLLALALARFFLA